MLQDINVKDLQVPDLFEISADNQLGSEVHTITFKMVRIDTGLDNKKKLTKRRN